MGALWAPPDAARLTWTVSYGKLTVVMSEPTTIEQVAPDLWRVPLVTPTLPPATRTHSFVWMAPAGIFVIDPGSPKPDELERLVALIEAQQTDAVRLRAYVVTHHHGDHWGGLGWMLDRLPAPVLAHSPARLNGLSADFRDLQWFNEGSAGASLLHTPGHAPDHLVLVLPGGDMLVGDMVAGQGTVVIDPPEGNLRDYLDSLRRMRAHQPRRLFPAHGPTIEEGLAKLDEYLAHRAMREGQILAAVREMEAATPEDLVLRIYTDTPLYLYVAAARSVLAHLIKLEEEGVVHKQRQRWCLTAR
jgi:glyoxylase-like metal-dependent hydrolase (beta-lactamase superfamily II)